MATRERHSSPRRLHYTATCERCDRREVMVQRKCSFPPKSLTRRHLRGNAHSRSSVRCLGANTESYPPTRCVTSTDGRSSSPSYRPCTCGRTPAPRPPPLGAPPPIARCRWPTRPSICPVSSALRGLQVPVPPISTHVDGPPCEITAKVVFKRVTVTVTK